MNAPIVPPAVIGMLGGGQLGRYALVAARTMGFRTMVVDPDPHAPAGRIADDHLVAAYDDDAVLDRIAGQCSVITTEFENPPAAALEYLARRTLVAPAPRAVAIAQDRIAEKAFLVDAGLPVGPYAVIDGPEADPNIAFPAIVKTARMGYDGRGQRRVGDASQMRAAWRLLGAVPCVVEQALDLQAEVSVVVARTHHGGFVAYPVSENRHVDGVLDLTIVPASVPRRVADRAVGIAMTIADQLGYVGVLAVECFVVDGEVLVNELAPRPHNSGHWTLDVAQTDQFAQQIRAVCGLPLGDVSMTQPAVAMVNLLGDRWEHGEPDWAASLADPRVALHLYGKAVARPGRKMGHLTAWASDPRTAETRAITARAAL